MSASDAEHMTPIAESVAAPEQPSGLAEDVPALAQPENGVDGSSSSQASVAEFTAEREATEETAQSTEGAEDASDDDESKQLDADSSAAPSATESAPNPNEWQAVWSPAHNAYYFFNSRTQETTWINPLQPPSTGDATSTALVAAAEQPVASTSTAVQQVAHHDPYAAAAIAGIDPELAYLDPALALPSLTPSGPMSYTAKFNARTGAFAKVDARTPEHLGEWERARRMSEMYFDVNQWEAEVAARKEQERQDELNGKKRKRPSKKDLERFKEQKKRKTIAKTAWLRT